MGVIRGRRANDAREKRNMKPGVCGGSNGRLGWLVWCAPCAGRSGLSPCAAGEWTEVNVRSRNNARRERDGSYTGLGDGGWWRTEQWRNRVGRPAGANIVARGTRALQQVIWGVETWHEASVMGEINAVQTRYRNLQCSETQYGVTMV